MDSIGPGTRVTVYGRFGGFLFVQTPAGRAGWIEG
jgi:hypothetical protein